jgi:iron complex outermembrane receptor protein
MEHEHQESEELRVASPKGGFVDYVTGVFFYRDFIDDHEKWLLDLSDGFGAPLGTVVFPVNYTNVTNSTNYAAFGEGNFHVTDKVTLIAGARETHERVDFHTAGLFLFDNNFAAADSTTANNLSWRLGARWEIDPQNMTYATASRGFKGPAYNGNTTSGDPQKVRPEVATSYEIGWKSEFGDKRIRTNLALFLTNLKDFQSQGYITPAGALTGEQFLTNAGEVRSQGVEFELQSSPAKNLAVNLNAAYIDAYYVNYSNAPCYTNQAGGCVGGNYQNLTGQRTPNTPKLAFNTDAHYDFILPGPFNAFVRADYVWRSKVQWDGTNDPLGVEGSVGLLGAGAGIASKDNHYTVTAYGRNLTNKFHTAGIQFGVSGTAQAELLPDFQRMWGVEFRYRY